MTVYDVCVIGSGAGAGPLATSLARAGKKVLILEKGPWYERDQFLRDEIVQVRRPNFYSDSQQEPQIEETWNGGIAGAGKSSGTFWNGNIVGGSSVFMSGFWTRMKPDDFKARTLYGEVAGGDRADWPIDYDDLEPWYAQVEQEIGVSGRMIDMPPTLTDKRSSALPLPPTREHPFSRLVDDVGTRLGLHPMPLPRAVLPDAARTLTPQHIADDREPCDYNGYCGSYACETGAKGSSLAAWIPKALRAGAEIRPHASVFYLDTDATGGRVTSARYMDRHGAVQVVEARAFVVACQAHESARLLLNSGRPKLHPYGLANRTGLVGRNLIFSTFGAGWGDFPYAKLDPQWSAVLRESREPFVNRVVQDYYWYDPSTSTSSLERNAGTGAAPGRGMEPGGTINFLLMHPNPISAAETQAFGEIGQTAPLWGQPLKDRLHYWFHGQKPLKFETFGEWIPSPSAYVAVDTGVKDRWGIPVARIRAFNHRRSVQNAVFLVEQGKRILTAMGATNARSVPRYGGPSTNLIAGTARMGEDPRTSVLDRDCRAWDLENLYVTDASCFPSGGRVPFTATIYANSLRVAEVLAKKV
ncbi:MAG: GMC family oxidoreductase [Planctomycetota bacterium]|nr:GMC family oxidoreductase [Planctomycetota bacterium]